MTASELHDVVTAGTVLEIDGELHTVSGTGAACIKTNNNTRRFSIPQLTKLMREGKLQIILFS